MLLSALNIQDYLSEKERQFLLPFIISFQSSANQGLKKDEFLMFKLMQDISPTYNLPVLFLSHGTTEELFESIKNIKSVRDSASPTVKAVCLGTQNSQGELHAFFNYVIHFKN